jgi:hypothetical protein
MRCKADQICRIIQSTAGNEGRHVVTMGLYDPAVHGWTANNNWLTAADQGPLWAVMPLQSLRSIALYGGRLSYGIGMTLYPDSWLEPIAPEAEAELGAVPADTEFAHG